MYKIAQTNYLWLKQKYYTPQFQPDMGSNSWPPDHDSTFHVTETPALTNQPLVNNLASFILIQEIAYRVEGNQLPLGVILNSHVVSLPLRSQTFVQWSTPWQIKMTWSVLSDFRTQNKHCYSARIKEVCRQVFTSQTEFCAIISIMIACLV